MGRGALRRALEHRGHLPQRQAVPWQQPAPDGFVNYIWPHRDDQIWPHPWARGTGYSASMNALSGGPDSRAVSGLWAMGGSFTSGCWRRGSVGPAGGGGVCEGGWGGRGGWVCRGGLPPGWGGWGRPGGGG